MKESCAPKKNRELNYTCYNKKALLKMKNNWNSRNIDNKIDSEELYEIWNELKKKMSSVCELESCWLKQEAVNDGLDTEILNYTFSPPKPTSWKLKPRKWLNSNDIKAVMKQYENEYKNFKFIGPSPIDYDSEDSYDSSEVCVWPELCRFNILTHMRNGINCIGIIFNLDKHTQGGSHWCCMCLDLRKKHLYYFDSYGKRIHDNMRRLGEEIISQGSKYNQDIKFIKLKNTHQRLNTECGVYCLYFISSILTNKHDYLYFENNRISDDEIFEYRSVFFN